METQKNNSRVAGLVAIILVIINPGFTICICGYMDWYALPGNIIAFALGWGALLMRKDKRAFTRIIVGLACVAATVVLLKNGADILWFGYDPLLK